MTIKIQCSMLTLVKLTFILANSSYLDLDKLYKSAQINSSYLIIYILSKSLAVTKLMSKFISIFYTRYFIMSCKYVIELDQEMQSIQSSDNR